MNLSILNRCGVDKVFRVVIMSNIILWVLLFTYTKIKRKDTKAIKDLTRFLRKVKLRVKGLVFYKLNYIIKKII